MSVIESNGSLEVTEEDHAHLYEAYTEGEYAQEGETFGPFTYVANQYDGTWRHGSEHLLVVKVEGHEGLWGVGVQDQDGDEPWCSLNPGSYGMAPDLLPVKAVQTVKYEVIR